MRGSLSKTCEHVLTRRSVGKPRLCSTTSTYVVERRAALDQRYYCRYVISSSQQDVLECVYAYMQLLGL